MSWKTLNNASGDVDLPTKAEMDAQRGLPADAAWDGSAGSASHTSIFKRIANFVATLGSPGDAAWDGASGTATEISILKRVAALLGATDPSVVVSLSDIVSATTFTRPADATAYAVGDLIANSATAGSVVPLSFAVARINAGTGNVRRARIFSSAPTDANAQMRLHLFRNAPTSTVGDNGVLSGALNGVASLYMGALDVTLDSVYSDGVAGIATPRMGGEVSFKTATADMLIYGVLEARSALTPTSGASYTVRLEVFRD